MGYVIAGIVVLLLVAGFVTFLVMNSMSKGGSAARGDASAPGVGGDSSPLGDTTEHAGSQTDRGTTSSDSERNAGEDDAARGLDPEQAESESEGEVPDRPARPEARQQRDAGAANPGPEPLADRSR